MNRKISQADLDATTRYDLHTRLEAMPKHDKLCHGDFNPSNIIISDDGTPYNTRLVACDTRQRICGRCTHLSALLACRRYRHGRQVSQTLLHKSDTAKQYVQKWMPIVAASQSVKGNAKEREFLLSWVSVVDYE